MYNDDIQEGFVEYTKYDDMKSPFFYCETPKWYLIWDIHFAFFTVVNNFTERYIVDVDSQTSKISYTYKYNRAGFPTSRIEDPAPISLAPSRFTYIDVSEK